jgi:hypothetical protein
MQDAASALVSHFGPQYIYGHQNLAHPIFTNFSLTAKIPYTVKTCIVQYAEAHWGEVVFLAAPLMA